MGNFPFPQRYRLSRVIRTNKTNYTMRSIQRQRELLLFTQTTSPSMDFKHVLNEEHSHL